MRMQIGGNIGQSSKKEGIVVRVKGFEEQGSQVGILGVNALTGEEVTVWLTDSGACADNKGRKTLKQLRDSFKMGSVRYKLEAGGLVHFKGCFPKKDSPKNYISTWANVLGYNAQSAKDSVVYIKNCFVRMFEPKDGDTWKPFGYVSSFQNRYIVGKNIQELQGQIAETRAEINNCTFLVRYLDRNSQVLGYLEIGSNKRFDKEKGCEFSPEDYGANCVALIEEQLANYNDVESVNILVAKTWSISREGLLSENNNKVKYWSWLASHFYKDIQEGENTYRDFFCRDAFGKLSDPFESQVFMNNLHFPWADEDVVTADPLLLGGLTYVGQEINAPKTETSPENESSGEPKREGRAVEEPVKVEPQADKSVEVSQKVEEQVAMVPEEEPVEENLEIDPAGRVVEKSPKAELQKQEKIQEPSRQMSIPPAASVPSDDYMDFEAALASGAF